MQQPGNNHNENRVPGGAPPRGDDAVSAQAREFEKGIRDCEAEHGPNHPDLADLLEEYAAFLRAKHMRALDAANLSARARVIRGTPPADAADDSERGDDEMAGPGRQDTAGGGKTVLAICAALVLLFAGSIFTLMADMNMRSHNRDLEIDQRARADSPYYEPAPRAARNYSGDARQTGGLIWATAGNPGERVDLNAILQKHKTTVVLFHSENCVYSSQMLSLVERFARARGDLCVCAVNIDRPDSEGIDFDSPVANQFDIHAVPKFRIYDERGVLAATDDEAKAQVKRWMQECRIAR
jgi:hypothetical protein